MISEIGYGLLAAFGWGTGDFLAKLSSDRIGYLRTTLYMQIVSGIFLIFFSLPDLPRLWQYPAATAGAAGLGIVSSVGLLALYRGFQIGRLSVVSPIVSGFPALTSLLAVIVLGEVLSEGRILGVIVTISGVILVSLQIQKKRAGNTTPLTSGVLYAIAAFVLFGVLYLAIKLVVVPLGVWLPILMLRWVSASVLAISLFASGRSFSFPNSSSFRLVGSVGVLDTLGNIAFNFGVISGSVAVVSTLSGLFSAVTIGLAWVRLRERFAWHQLVGILAILGGVILIGYFG